MEGGQAALFIECSAASSPSGTHLFPSRMNPALQVHEATPLTTWQAPLVGHWSEVQELTAETWRTGGVERDVMGRDGMGWDDMGWKWVRGC